MDFLLTFVRYLCAMGKTIIPTSVRAKTEECGLNGVRRILTSDARYGDVYELYFKGNSKTLTMPTGLPHLVAYKDGAATDVPAKEAFELLAAITS